MSGSNTRQHGNSCISEPFEQVVYLERNASNSTCKTDGENEITGIETITAQEIIVAPNPTNNHFTVSFLNSEMSKEYALSFTDIQGKVLNIQADYANNSYTINVANFSKGVYLLHLTGAKNSIVKKVIIE